MAKARCPSAASVPQRLDAKDCKSLTSSKSWNLENGHAFNFFPGTDSVKVLVIFKRESEGVQKKRKKAKKEKAK